MARVSDRIDGGSPLLFYRGFDYGATFYAHRHIPAYADHFGELKRPYYLLMWEEDYQRLAPTNRLRPIDTSEGKGPAARHRLMLVEPEQDSAIADPKGYDRFDDDND